MASNRFLQSAKSYWTACEAFSFLFLFFIHQMEEKKNFCVQISTRFQKEQLLLEELNDNTTQEISASQSHLSGLCQQALREAIWKI